MNKFHGHSSFHVGDRVTIDFGRRTLTGVIVEDRGALGVQGRRLSQVRIPVDPFEPMIVELPEDQMKAVAAETGPPRPIDKDKIIAYLVNGGLVAILRANISSEGRNQSRTWLCLDSLGNVTHTFDPERGVTGGQFIPLW